MIKDQVTATHRQAISIFFGIVLFSALPASAFTSDDANTIMDAFNKAFYVDTPAGGHYKNTQVKGTTYFWEQAEEIEGIEDAYERSWNPEYKDKIVKLLHGFNKTNGSKWDHNKYNDDCMWACIAFSRAYLDIGDTSFMETAQLNFDMVYRRAWDSTLDGGLWWTTENTTKNACINGPGAIAAYLLYLSTGKPEYLQKANDIYDWERSHLFNESNGQVYDALNSKGVFNKWASSYNQGTFVGVANFLGKIKDATLATDYTMNKMGSRGEGNYLLMPVYKINDNNSGFNGIGIRWIAKFVKDNNLQGSYVEWLQANANAAWKVRRTSDNLSWCQWHNPTPPDEIFHSWDCSSSVVALQVVPPDNKAAPENADQGTSMNQEEATNGAPALESPVAKDPVAPSTNQDGTTNGAPIVATDQVPAITSDGSTNQDATTNLAPAMGPSTAVPDASTNQDGATTTNLAPADQSATTNQTTPPSSEVK